LLTSSHHARKRILSLDGGGIFGLFTIEVLARIEHLLRDHYGRPGLVLADHFQMIAGTSTGAIVGTFLSCGGEVGEIRRLYIEKATAMFRKAPLWQWHRAKFCQEGLAAFLKDYFREANGEIATLGSEILKTRLLLVMRNATTGASWPVSNNPKAKYNQRFKEDGSPDLECNLLLPLWQLVRASAAAPWYFPPETIQLGSQRFLFIDGAVTPFNNPSQIAFLMATLPCYGGDWETGTDKLHLVSIGTRRLRTVWNPKRAAVPSRLAQVGMSLGAFLDTIGLQQDLTCRVLGECRFGDAIDTEVGDLIPETPGRPSDKKFSYVRYDRFYTTEEVARIAKQHGGFGIDNLRLIPLLQEIGQLYACKNVRLDHLL